MVDNSSLKFLLQTLVNAPEVEKKAVVYSLIKALRESCGLFYRSKFTEYQHIARATQKILDDILGEESSTETLPKQIDQVKNFHEEQQDDEEQDIEEVQTDLAEEHGGFNEDEEFVESGAFNEPEKVEPLATTQAKIEAIEEAPNTPETRFIKQIAQWNNSCPKWLKLPSGKVQDSNSIVEVLLSAVALRSNITSNQFDGQEQILQKFDDNWQQIVKILEETGYQFSPTTLVASQSSNLLGKIIYTCRPRSSGEEVELVAPRISYQGRVLRESVWVVVLPIDAEFPASHPNVSLPSHWRGVFGEIDLLLEHLDMHPDAHCAMEGINKNRVEPLSECRANMIAETKRRSDVLSATVQKEAETIYRLATDYWRIEECFWSVFHEDERIAGCSYFDRLRNRLQSWRTTLRRVHKFHIRDFACGNDSLASVNQYIGNIILQPKKNVAAGIVIKELRPAIVIKDQNTSRLLKGRVIAT